MEDILDYRPEVSLEQSQNILDDSQDSCGPFLSVLSFSAGAQSTCLLEMVLNGDIEKPNRFVVINADPGMEDERSYKITRDYRKKCYDSGIDFITASGPNLYNDIVSLPMNGNRRIDNPPYWTKGEDGKRGRLKQGCTQKYKIAPMRRALRQYLSNKYGISDGQLRKGLVESWIGFALDEWHRCSESDVAYIQFRFPLIEMKLERKDVEEYYKKRNVSIPPRSVCSGCFANGLAYFKDMYENRPSDWEKAVDVDNSVENWHKLGFIQNECFVSSSMMRLRDLPAINFGIESEDLSEYHCNSGVCFL